MKKIISLFLFMFFVGCTPTQISTIEKYINEGITVFEGIEPFISQLQAKGQILSPTQITNINNYLQAGSSTFDKVLNEVSSGDSGLKQADSDLKALIQTYQGLGLSNVGPTVNNVFIAANAAVAALDILVLNTQATSTGGAKANISLSEKVILISKKSSYEKRAKAIASNLVK